MRQGIDWSKMCDLAWAWEQRPHCITQRMKRSYGALKQALLHQYHEMLRHYGVTVEWVSDDPWETSHGMFECIDKLGRLIVLKTDLSTLPDDHPLAERGALMGARPHVKGSPMTRLDPMSLSVCWNDVFRAVHDFYGHYLPRRSFSPQGEEMATRYHALSMPSEAIPALINETRCQQAYMLYGVHVRQKWQSVMPKEWRIEGWCPYSGTKFMKAYPMRDRPFAPQKVVDLGHWMNTPFTYPDDREEEELVW